MRKHSKLEVPLTLTDWSLEAVSFVSFLFVIAYSLNIYFDLPEIIPTYFDLQGQIQVYGDRIHFWRGAIILIFIYLGITLLQQYTGLFQYSKEDNDKLNRDIQKLLRRLLMNIKTFVAWIVLCIQIETVNVAILHHSSVDMFNIWVTVGIIILSVAYYSILIIKKYRKYS